MNKSELIDHIASQAELSKIDAGKAVDALVDGIAMSLRQGKKVTLVGFGTFSTSDRKARTGRNPRTGESIEIEAKRVARFKPGKELADRVNG